jgi:hypothetical protein
MLFFFLSLFFAPTQSAEVIIGSPTDLSENVLLVPRFDLFDFEDPEVEGKPREYLIRHNQEAKRLNTVFMNAASKNYPYTYELVRMKDVDKRMVEGAKYLLEVVNLPKSATSFPEEIVNQPAHLRYTIAEEMYRIPPSGQWHVFYVRDLRTGDIYLPGGWKGKAELADAIAATFKALR